MDLLSKIIAVPIFSYSDKVELLFNGYKYSHDTIIIENKFTEEKHNINNVDNSMKNNSLLEIKTLLINNIDPGVYNLYSTNADQTEESIKTEITVVGDTKRAIVEKAISFIGVDKTEHPYIDIIGKIVETTNIVSFLFDKINNETDDMTKYKYASSLYSLVDFLNYNMSRSIIDGQIEIDTMQSLIIVDPEIKQVLVMDITDSKNPDIQMVPKTIASDSIKLLLQERHLYAVIPVDVDENYRGVYYFLKPEQSLFSRFWTNIVTRNKEYQLIIEKNVDYPNSYMDFSDNERELLALVDKLTPIQPLIKEPTLAYDVGIITVQVKDIALLIALNKDFYLSIREPELALDPNDQRRIKISGEEFQFYASSLMIVDENYLYWIEDANGMILSPVKLFSLSSIDYSDGTIEMPKVEFNERIRQLALYNYSSHLIPYLANNFTEYKELIMNAFKSAETDESTGVEDLSKTILKLLCLRQNYSKLRACIRAMMEDRTIYGNYLVEFLASPVRFKYKENTVVMPPKQNCLFVFDKYTTDQGLETTYIMSQINAATEYRFYDCDYGVIWCIDTDTYKTSGFILLDFSTKQLEPYSYKFLIDELEVIY